MEPSEIVGPASAAKKQSEWQTSQKFSTLTYPEYASFNTNMYAVLDWADNKGILNTADATRQMCKCMSEVGELADEILKGNRDNAEMELGDVLVTLICVANITGINPELALQKAYNKISKRTGTTVNGVFIKEETNGNG